ISARIWHEMRRRPAMRSYTPHHAARSLATVVVGALYACFLRAAAALATRISGMPSTLGEWRGRDCPTRRAHDPHYVERRALLYLLGNLGILALAPSGVLTFSGQG